MDKYLVHSNKFGVLLMLTMSLWLLSCQNNESNPDLKVPLNDHFGFTSPVTSVSLYDSTLYVGVMGNCFIEFDPSKNKSKSYMLPDRLKNKETYFVYPLGNNRFIVSKRDHGVTFVEYGQDDNSESTIFENEVTLKQQNVGFPEKGEHYSSYNIYPLADKLLIGSTNGLLELPKSYSPFDKNAGDKNIIGYDTIGFVEALKEYRNGKNEFIIEDIRPCGKVSDFVEVFTKDAVWRLSSSKDEPEPLQPSDKYDGYKRCFENWYITETGDSLVHFSTDNLGNRTGIDSKYYIGELGIKPGKGSNMVVLGPTLYYVANNKLNHMNLPKASLLGSNKYETLLLTAWNKERIYLVNPSGVYSYEPGEEAKYLHPIKDLNTLVTATGVPYNNDIYAIDSENLVKITPIGRWNPFPTVISPSVVANITQGYDEARGQSDQLKCLSLHGDTLYIGSRNTIYSYDLSAKGPKEVAWLEDMDVHNKVKNDTCSNPYFTSISYPYAGTLHSGIYKIEGKGFHNVLEGPNDIDKVVYSEPFLACKTNVDVRLYQCDPKDETPSLINVKTVSDTILDIGLTKEYLYVLTGKSLDRLSLKDLVGENEAANPQWFSEPNYGYTSLANIGDSMVYYSDMSVVSNQMSSANRSVLKANPVNWLLVLAKIVAAIAILLWLIALFTKNLQRKRMNKKNTELMTTIETMKEADAQKDRRLSETTESLKEAKELNKQLCTTVSSLESSIAQKDGQLHDVEDKLKAAEESNSQLTSTAETLRGELTAKDGQLHDVEDKLKEAQKSNTELSSTIETLTCEMEQKEKVLGTTQTQLKEAEERESQLRENETLLKDNVAQLEEQIRQVQDQLTIVEESKSQVVSQMGSLQAMEQEHIKLLACLEKSVYNKAKTLKRDLFLSDYLQTFMGVGEPEGNAGRLHSQMLNRLNELSIVEEDDLDGVMAARTGLLTLSKAIIDGFKGLVPQLDYYKKVCKTNLEATENTEFKEPCQAAIGKVVGILHSVAKFDIDRSEVGFVLQSLAIIEKLEEVYPEIDKMLRTDRFISLSDEVVKDGDKANVDAFTNCLLQRRALISSLFSKSGKSVLFYNTNATDDNKGFEFVWDGLILLSLTELEPTKVKEYLKEKYFGVTEEDNDIQEAGKTESAKNAWRHIRDSKSGGVYSFFNRFSTIDVWERRSFIPTKPLDLLLISSLRFYDRKDQIGKIED